MYGYIWGSDKTTNFEGYILVTRSGWLRDKSLLLLLFLIFLGWEILGCLALGLVLSPKPGLKY